MKGDLIVLSEKQKMSLFSISFFQPEKCVIETTQSHQDLSPVSVIRTQ